MRRLGLTSAMVALVASGPSVSEPIHEAARTGDLAAIAALIDAGTPVDQPSTVDTSVPGVTALFVAAKWGKMDAAEMLMDAGADPNFCSVDARDTPLTMATKIGKTDLMALLIDRGADPNQRCGGSLALHWAKQLRRQKAADLLVERGAITSFARPSIEPLLAGADVERGARLVKTCHFCHGRDAESPDLDGATLPRLWNIVGREKAAQPGFRYSVALKEAGGTWTYDELNSFLADPFGFIPGTDMGLASLHPTDEQRADIIGYLRTLSDDPVPLP